MKSFLHNSKWAIACAIVALPFFTGCGEPAKEGIDKSEPTVEIAVDEEEMKKPSKSIGIAD